MFGLALVIVGVGLGVCFSILVATERICHALQPQEQKGPGDGANT